uniref:Uncharacterized protein n=1 Tax=Anopheles epiroticus TaxID=199890 RepID=A0A182PWL8_9DIPT
MKSLTIPMWKEIREEFDRLSNQVYYEPRKRVAARPAPNNATSRSERTLLTATAHSNALNSATAVDPVPHSKNVARTSLKARYKTAAIKENSRIYIHPSKIFSLNTLATQFSPRPRMQCLDVARAQIMRGSSTPHFTKIQMRLLRGVNANTLVAYIL